MENVPEKDNPNHSAAPPLLSVVITAGLRRRRALRCIDAVLSQQGVEPMEVVVVDVCPGAGPIERRGIAVTPAPDCASINAAKAAGARVARGALIAFLEDHCVPEPGWARAVCQEFAGHPEAQAVGFTFANLNPVNWVSRSFLLLAYGPWMAPAESGPVPAPSWMNVAYRREVLERLPDISSWLDCEMLNLLHLRRQGAVFRQAGGACVKHLNHPGLLGSARDSACWQRLHAAARAEAERWGWFRRAAYFCGAVPFSPSIIAFRLGRRMMERGMGRQFLEALPLVLFVYTWGAFSEAMGYVAGRGDTPRRTILVETEDPRGEEP